MPDFDNNYVQIIQAKDTVVLLTEHQTKIVPLDGRPHVSEKLRSWSGDRGDAGKARPSSSKPGTSTADSELCRCGQLARQGRDRARHSDSRNALE